MFNLFKEHSVPTTIKLFSTVTTWTISWVDQFVAEGTWGSDLPWSCDIGL